MRLIMAFLLLLGANAQRRQKRNLFDPTRMEHVIEVETQRTAIDDNNLIDSSEEIEAEVAAIVDLYDIKNGEGTEETNDDFNFDYNEADYTTNNIKIYATATDDDNLMIAPTLRPTLSGKAEMMLGKSAKDGKRNNSGHIIPSAYPTYIKQDDDDNNDVKPAKSAKEHHEIAKAKSGKANAKGGKTAEPTLAPTIEPTEPTTSPTSSPTSSPTISEEPTFVMPTSSPILSGKSEKKKSSSKSEKQHFSSKSEKDKKGKAERISMSY